MLAIIKTVRTAVLVYLTHEIALPVLKIFRRPIKFPYDMAQLGILPKGSLGHDLYCFLSTRKLQLLPYYARHDLKHVLLNYDTTDKGEACLQCFMLGNGRVSFPVLATVVYAFCTMPEYWQDMRLAHQKGKACRPIHQWNWTELLSHQTGDLQKQLSKRTNCSNK